MKIKKESDLSFKNTKTTYGSLNKILHWGMALLIIGMLTFGFFMDDFSKPLKPTIYMVHKSIGLLILALAILRLVWKVINKGMPDYHESLTRTQQKLVTAGHHTLYLLMFIMPMTGLLMSIAAKRYPTFFNLFTVNIPGVPQTKAFGGFMNESHKILAWVFIIMVTMHVGAALYHRFIKNDGVLERML
jgi:cytochrome b561